MNTDSLFEQVKDYKELYVNAIVMIQTPYRLDQFLECGNYRPNSILITCKNNKFIIPDRLTLKCLACLHEIPLFTYPLNRIYICNKVSWILV